MSIIKEKQISISHSESCVTALSTIAEYWGKSYELIPPASSNVNDEAKAKRQLKIWLDQDKDVFLKIALKSDYFYQAYTQVDFCHGNSVFTIINEPNIEPALVYYDRNPGGDVLFFRAETADNLPVTFIAARDDAGNWFCVFNNSIVTTTGIYSTGSGNIAPVENISYSAFTMPNVVNNKLCSHLLKIATTRSSSPHNLYVAFQDKVYHMVSVVFNDSEHYNVPGYAFEPQQE